MKLKLLTVLCLFMSVPSFAKTTGNEFLAWDDSSQGFYVYGVLDMLNNVEYITTVFQEIKNDKLTDGIPGYKVILKHYSNCSVSEVTYGQVHKIVLKYMEDHPSELHFNAEVLIFKSLQNAFPCPK